MPLSKEEKAMKKMIHGMTWYTQKHTLSHMHIRIYFDSRNGGPRTQELDYFGAVNFHRLILS